MLQHIKSSPVLLSNLLIFSSVSILVFTLVTKEKPFRNQAISGDFGERRATFLKFMVVTLLNIEVFLFFLKRDEFLQSVLSTAFRLKQKIPGWPCPGISEWKKGANTSAGQKQQWRGFTVGLQERAAVWGTVLSSSVYRFGLKKSFMLKEKRAITAEQMWKLLSGKITITRDVLNVDLLSDLASVSLS